MFFQKIHTDIIGISLILLVRPMDFKRFGWVANMAFYDHVEIVFKLNEHAAEIVTILLFDQGLR